VERITIAQRLVSQMLAEALASPQREICGLLAARSGQAVRCVSIPNVAGDPTSRYRMEPGRQIAAFRELRERGEQLYAIYHSHPRGCAAPSDADIAEATYPEAYQLIIALRAERPPELRAWRIEHGAARPVALSIRSAAGGPG
jgi:proteasome lid subunit RPN8/RPN11